MWLHILLLLALGGLNDAAVACDANLLFKALLPLAGRYPACQALSSYDFTQALSGTLPTVDQARLMRSLANCTALNHDLQTQVGLVGRNCTIQGQSTAAIANMSLPDALAFLVASTSVSASDTITAPPASSLPRPSAAASPTLSFVASAGLVAVAAVHF
ncbi:Aste57867_14009 [Aphanomyces stellatus]|uniref:Aste57867_14009 protein n=1 Tax=Aphanomyces stellatus TaxID=120398 RepID=A0A485L1U2_9STRA|nr:hypothetical protein As57867_013958 [Aphanomyces stellatus]VFT90839.1 Aste57867_14009 [Aphanomyces stellatus]